MGCQAPSANCICFLGWIYSSLNISIIRCLTWTTIGIVAVTALLIGSGGWSRRYLSPEPLMVPTGKTGQVKQISSSGKNANNFGIIEDHSASTRKRDKLERCVWDKKNVLFLTFDDLVGDLPLAKDDQSLMSNGQRLHIPNLRQLAEKSLVFRAAYSQYPLCNPSRASMLTGRRPDTTQVYYLKKSFRSLGKNFTTIPEYFKQNGYHSVGMGKVFHFCSSDPYGERQDPQSWSEKFAIGGGWIRQWKEQVGNGWKSVPTDEPRGHRLPDEENVEYAIRFLRNFSQSCTQFFLALGFFSPHEPIIFPQEIAEKYYPLREIRLPLILEHEEDLPKYTLTEVHSLFFQRSGKLIASQKLKADGSNWEILTKRRRQAYFSAITFLDQLIGRLLDVLGDTGLDKNTIVTLVSDHGLKMGDHGGWAKNALFDADTHVPWIMRIPEVADRGIQIENPVELVDVFPTLVGASGLPPVVECPEDSVLVKTCHEGMNILAVLDNGKLNRTRPAFSQVARKDGIMGRSLRTAHYRYTEYTKSDGLTHIPMWNLPNEAELYDYKSEFGEGINRVTDPMYARVRRHLQKLLHSGWRNKIPITQMSTL